MGGGGDPLPTAFFFSKFTFIFFVNSLGTKKKVSGNARCIVLEENAGPSKVAHLLAGEEKVCSYHARAV